jgi:hypothetical protein
MTRPLPTQSDSKPIRVLRYTLRCLNGHEVEYETSEWPGLIPVHCLDEACGWQVPTFPTGDPVVVKPDAFGRPVCDYCGDLRVNDRDNWWFCCGAQEEDAAREERSRWM